MRSIAISAALIAALAIPAAAETVIVRPPVRVVRVIQAPVERRVVVEVPQAAPAPTVIIRAPVIQLGSPCIVALLGVCVKL